MSPKSIKNKEKARKMNKKKVRNCESEQQQQ